MVDLIKKYIRKLLIFLKTGGVVKWLQKIIGDLGDWKLHSETTGLKFF